MRSVHDSLPAQLYLLACDPAKERVTNRELLGYAVRAAVLAELESAGCLRDEAGKAAPRDRRTGDPLLDDVLGSIVPRPSRARRWKTLIEKEQRRTLDALESELQSAGLISVERRVLRRRRVRAHDHELPHRLRAMAADIVCGDVPVYQVERRHAALAALATLCKLSPLVTWRDRHRNRIRLQELTALSGPAGPALKAALDARSRSSGGGGDGGDGGDGGGE